MHIQYFAVAFSAVYQHTYPHKDRKWHTEEISYNFKLSAKGETPHGSIVSMDVSSIKSYNKKSYYKCMLLNKC